MIEPFIARIPEPEREIYAKWRDVCERIHDNAALNARARLSAILNFRLWSRHSQLLVTLPTPRKVRLAR